MATPESNTALGIGLFQPAAQVITRGNDEKVALLTRLAEIANAQHFQRGMATQAQENAVRLENLRADNSRALAKDTTDRQLAVTKQAQEAVDQRDLQKNFSLSYPIYAQAAAVLGEKPKEISEFDHSWDGLAELQGEMSALKERAQKQEKTAAAKGVVAILDQSTQQLDDAIRARNEGIKLTSADQAQARNMGLRALQQAANTGAIPGLDPKDKKFGRALAALSKDEPDIAVASELLGPAGIQAYAGGVQSGLLALTNDKDRLARITSLSRDVQTAQRGASENLTRLMTLASTNPELGTMLDERASRLSTLNKSAVSEPAPTDTQSVFKSLIGSPASAAPSVSQPAPAGGGFMDRIKSMFGTSATPPPTPGMFGIPSAPLASGPGMFGVGTGAAPRPVVAPQPTPQPQLPALHSIAPPDNSLPPEVEQAATIIANNPHSREIEPYKSALRAWLDNNGQGRPYAPENVELRKLLDVQPGY